MRRFWHLLGSMPFAVAILAVVAVAASIGSLVEQNQPFAAQVGDVGLWWATVHARLGVDDVYRAPWFLALLSLMTLSTALCVWRKTPGMWREARTHRAHLGVPFHPRRLELLIRLAQRLACLLKSLHPCQTKPLPGDVDRGRLPVELCGEGTPVEFSEQRLGLG